MHLQENYKMEEFSFSLSHYSIRHHFSILSNDSHMLGFEIFFNDWIIFGLFHFRKDLYYIETSKIIDSVNHLTGFCLILPFIEKEVLNSLYSVILYSTEFVIFVKFNPGQFYFTNYQDSFKSNLCKAFLKIDVPAKRETINTYEGVHFLVKLQAVGYWYIWIFFRFLC